MKNVLNLGLVLVLVILFIVLGQDKSLTNEEGLKTAGMASEVVLDEVDSTSMLSIQETGQGVKSSIFTKEHISIVMLIILLGMIAFILQHSWRTIRTD